MPTRLMEVGPGIEHTGYPCVIDTLASEGIISSRAFSLDLRGVDSLDGKSFILAMSLLTYLVAIIFGGIDTMKYSGLLEKRPIIPASRSPDDFDR